MKPLFSYLDYRKFLRERFAWLKKNRRGTSHRSLSRKAGFASPNFLKLLMEGERNLSLSSIPKVALAFELNPKESDFFSNLVAFNQAKTLSEQERAFAVLRQNLRPLPIKTLAHSQLEYFDGWYNSAIRELAELENFRPEPQWIQERLIEKISVKEIRKSLELLKGLGLLQENNSGQWNSTSQPITSGDEVASLSLYRFHRQMIQKGLESLDKTPPEHRDVSGLTLPISQGCFTKIKERLQEFRKEILGMVQADKKAEAVYQLNVQFFNLTEPLWESK